MKRFKRYFLRIVNHFQSMETQAKKAGVKMGGGNFIVSRFWEPSEPYLIEVGENCQITAGVKFYTHGGAGAVRRWYPNFDTFGKIKIGSFVYIGNNVMVMPGVTIGDNVLIAAGSVVTKSIPDNCVVGGNPARFICSIEDYIERNKSYNTESKGLNPMEKKRFLLSLSEDRFVRKSEISKTSRR